MSEQIEQEARERYSHANVRDRYDADLMMAGFHDGAEWALSRLASPTDEEVRALAAARKWIESGGPGVRVLRILVAMAERGAETTDQSIGGRDE